MPARLRIGFHGRISAARLASGRWKAQARLATPQGTRLVARTGDTRRKAEEELSQYLQEYATSVARRSRRTITMGQLADEFIEYRGLLHE